MTAASTVAGSVFTGERGRDEAFSSLGLSARLLSLTGAIALIATRECNPRFVSVFFVMFAFGWLLRRRAETQRLLGRFQTAFAIASFVIVVLDLVYWSNSFLLAIAHFLLAIAGLRALALQTPRDILGGVLIASMMILSSATLAVDWTFLAGLLVFVPLLAFTLMNLNVVREMDEGAAGISRWRTAGFDWKRVQPVLSGMTLMATLVSVGSCAVIFAIFPRFNFQAFRGQYLQPVRTTGFTLQVDLRPDGRIFQDDAVAMRVEIPPSDRGGWSGYLRGSALESYRHGVWRRSGAPSERLFATTGGRFGFYTGSKRVVSAKRIHQSIYLESMESPNLFSAPNPMSLRIDRPFLEIGKDGAIQRRAGDGWRVHYDVDSISVPVIRTDVVPTTAEPARPRGGEHRKAEQRLAAIIDEVPAYWIISPTLPSVGGAASEPGAETMTAEEIPASVVELGERLIPTHVRPLEAALTVADYLRRNYRYTLNIRSTPGAPTPIEDFLFFRKSGHCEFFASAACLLLRSRGIPARLVAGFLSTETNDRGGYVVVRMKHAHAWVEVWVPGRGWAMVDPTPRSDAPDFAKGILKSWWEAWDFMNLRWNRYILSYDLERQVSIFRSVTQGSDRVADRMWEWLRPFQRISGQIWNRFRRGHFSRVRGRAVGGALAAVLGALFVVGVWHWFRRKMGASSVWFYRPLSAFLESAAGPRELDETIREWSFRARDRTPEAVRTDLRLLIDSYERQRFGGVDPRKLFDEREFRVALRRLKETGPSHRRDSVSPKLPAEATREG